MPTIALIKVEVDKDHLKVTAPEIGETYFYEVYTPLPDYYQIVLHVGPYGVTGVTIEYETGG